MATYALDTINERLHELWTEFEENHNNHASKGNKAAGKRARKALGNVKKLVTEYRKHSVAADK
jgi:NAD(P)H-dependent FMN reductase